MPLTGDLKNNIFFQYVDSPEKECMPPRHTFKVWHMFSSSSQLYVFDFILYFKKKVLFQDLHPIIVETFTDTLKVGGVVREMPK